VSDVADYSEQPPPIVVPDAVSVHDLVVQDLLAMEEVPGYIQAGIDAMEERKAFGLRKYGTVLHAANGRDYFKDVDDEAGDLVVYIRALMESHPELADRLKPDYFTALGIMVRLRLLLMENKCPSA
jgi:hypothetical protein